VLCVCVRACLCCLREKTEGDTHSQTCAGFFRFLDFSKTPPLEKNFCTIHQEFCFAKGEALVSMTRLYIYICNRQLLKRTLRRVEGTHILNDSITAESYILSRVLFCGLLIFFFSFRFLNFLFCGCLGEERLLTFQLFGSLI